MGVHKEKISKLISIILFLLICLSTIVSANNKTKNKNVILPAISFDDNEKYFIKELNVDTGLVKKNFIQVNGIVCDEIDRFVDIGNGNIIMVGMETSSKHEGYCLIYNIYSNKLTRFNFRAIDPDDIEVNKNNSYFVINYCCYDQSNDSGETTTFVCDINTLQIKSKWKNDYQKLVSIDNNHLYYQDNDDVVICSITNGKEIKRVPRNISYDIYNNGQALGHDANGAYRLTDLLTQKSKTFNFPADKIGYEYLSEDNKWLVVLLANSTKSKKIKFNGEIVIINTVSGDQKPITTNAENLNTDLIRSGDAIFFRNNQVYLCGETSLVSINLDNGKTTSKTFVYAPTTLNRKIDPIGTTKIEKLVSSYENSLVKAINTGNFFVVEPYLTPGSNLYISQKKLVSNLYGKQTKEKLITFDVKEIKSSSNDMFKVCVTEKIGIKTAAQKDFTIKEFRWVYTVVEKNGIFTLCDIERYLVFKSK